MAAHSFEDVIAIYGRIKVTENHYSGIPTIRRMMQEYDLQQPEFLDERGIFIVKLYKSVIEQKADEMEEVKMSIPEKPKSPKQLFYCD